MTKSHVIDVPSKNIKNVPVCKFLEIRTFRVAPIQVKDCLLRCAEIRTSLKSFSYSLKKFLIHLFPMHHFYTPWKTSEKRLTVLWCFQGVEKGCIGDEWVNGKFIFYTVAHWKHERKSCAVLRTDLIVLLKCCFCRRTGNNQWIGLLILCFNASKSFCDDTNEPRSTD